MYNIRNRNIKLNDLQVMEYKDVFHENDFISRQITEEIEKLMVIDKLDNIENSIIIISSYDAWKMGLPDDFSRPIGIFKFKEFASNTIYVNGYLSADDNKFYVIDKEGFYNYEINLLESGKFNYSLNFDITKIRRVDGRYSAIINSSKFVLADKQSEIKMSKTEFQLLANKFLTEKEVGPFTPQRQVEILHESLNLFYIWLTKNFWKE